MLKLFTTNLTKKMLSRAAENDIERTIYRLAGVKQIAAFKGGGSWRFLR